MRNSHPVYVIWHTFKRIAKNISLVNSSLNQITQHYDSAHKLFIIFFFCIPSYISRIHFWWDFCVCDLLFLFLKNPTRGSHIPSSWMVHAACAFVAGIHLSRTWTSGSYKFMWWNACIQRLDLSLYPCLLQWKNPLKQKVLRRVKRAMLHHAGQQAQHTTNWAVLAPTLKL